MSDPFCVFFGFAAEDRYTIAEPIVYHLKNYGIPTWYDRHKLLLGDDRKEKNLIDGAGKSKYACAIISENTEASACAMEELAIIRERYFRKEMTVFPILYELPPDKIPIDLHWIKEAIFKETNRTSGTREICNHIACKITGDILSTYTIKHVSWYKLVWSRNQCRTSRTTSYQPFLYILFIIPGTLKQERPLCPFHFKAERERGLRDTLYPRRCLRTGRARSHENDDCLCR